MFSIVVPIDPNRLRQFEYTKREYDKMPQEKELILVTRNEYNIKKYLKRYQLEKDVRVIPYKFLDGFNCSMALNIGVRESKYDNIIITSPEVKPAPDVLDKLEQSIGTNIICQVADELEGGDIGQILVYHGFRDESPAMYFLAMFKKNDIARINGWDEEFMKGYAYEDNDFGARWVRAGIPFEIREDIKAVHQYHPRYETKPGGAGINYQHFGDNNQNVVIRCENGLDKF